MRLEHRIFSYNALEDENSERFKEKVSILPQCVSFYHRSRGMTTGVSICLLGVDADEM
jgi:hypothetical protein